MFPTGHFQSKSGVLEDELGEERVLKAFEERGDVSKTNVLDNLLREREVAPPSISKEGARRVMKRLTDEANIELENGHEYLKPHGARRELGAELYALGESEKDRIPRIVSGLSSQSSNGSSGGCSDMVSRSPTWGVSPSAPENKR